MAKTKPTDVVTPPVDFDTSRVIWPLTLEGVREAWLTLVPPLQAWLKTHRIAGKQHAVVSMSKAVGIAESKIKAIDKKLADLGLAEDDESAQPEPASRFPVVVVDITRQTVEALIKAGVLLSEPPSKWPGSPEQSGDDVRDAQLKEYALSALECIVLMHDHVLSDRPNHTQQWAIGGAILTDKLLEGTKLKRARLTAGYEQRLMRLVVQAAWTLKDQPTQEIARLLMEGKMRKQATIRIAIGSLAMALINFNLPADAIEQDESLAAMAYIIARRRKETNTAA